MARPVAVTRLDEADVLIRDGRIAAVGSGLAAEGAAVVDATDRWITPGIIDTHSHLGVYASPGVQSHSDGNEITGAVTAEVWAEHGVWPHDPGFITALAGGVTSMQILPGSANLIGGRSVTLITDRAEFGLRCLQIFDVLRQLRFKCFQIGGELLEHLPLPAALRYRPGWMSPGRC